MRNTRGRPPGRQNRVPAYLKQVIMEALEAAGEKGGAVAYMTRLADKRPEVFASLLRRLPPVRVVDEGANEPAITVDAVQLARLTREQREALQEAMRILMPDRFSEFRMLSSEVRPEMTLHKGVYDPDG